MMQESKTNESYVMCLASVQWMYTIYTLIYYFFWGSEKSLYIKQCVQTSLAWNFIRQKTFFGCLSNSVLYLKIIFLRYMWVLSVYYKCHPNKTFNQQQSMFWYKHRVKMILIKWINYSNMKKKKKNPDLTNQFIHQIFYGPSIARSQSLVMHLLILTLSKMLLRCYSLSLMNWKARQWQLGTWFQIPSKLMSRVTNASVFLPKIKN